MSDEIDDLIEKLRTSHDGEREHAAKKLGELKDARAVGPLIKALGDADSLVQDNAMQALGKIGKPAVEPLIKALEYADSEVQWYAARIRGNAALALGMIGDAKAVEPLVELLGDADSTVRRNATWALEWIGEPAAGKLVEAAKDPEKKALRGTISEILKKINNIAKCNSHDFGCVEKERLKPPEIPKEFERLALKDVPKAKVPS